MKTPAPPLDLKKADAKLRQWQKRHDTPEKVAAAHRKVILERVVESMVFENEPVSMARLKALLKERAAQKEESKLGSSKSKRVDREEGNG